MSINVVGKANNQQHLENDASFSAGKEGGGHCSLRVKAADL